MESSAESPLPVRTVALAIGGWVGRLGRVWVEGQITQLTRRPGQATCFLVLRDTAAEMSLQVAAPRSLVDALDPPLAEGGRVVVWAQPEFRPQRGTLSLTAYDVRPVGVGALLARLEQLRKTLAAAGLFAAERKRPLPFPPRPIGLVTGRASAAERDVVDNARRRWPAVQFRIENVAVQGGYAGTEVIAAVQRLDNDGSVDVIVVARGGGSVEDLLPFSDEALVRAVHAIRTPLVPPIGAQPAPPLRDRARARPPHPRPRGRPARLDADRRRQARGARRGRGGPARAAGPRAGPDGHPGADRPRAPPARGAPVPAEPGRPALRARGAPGGDRRVRRTGAAHLPAPT